MVETFFGFKKPAFGDNPDAKQWFASQSWTQVKARLQFLVDHHGAGLLTGEVGTGKSTVRPLIMPSTCHTETQPRSRSPGITRHNPALGITGQCHE
jgi:type II secretory pathway predicted ATPase ExeA